MLSLKSGLYLITWKKVYTYTRID